MFRELTKEEESAIRALNRIANKWPDGLWIYAADGVLHVMLQGADGGHAFVGDGIDPDYIVDSISIESSGGDW